MRLKKISKEFERKLAGISAGVLSSDEFEKLINIFEAEIYRVYFTSSSEANLFRIVNGMYDKVFLIRECVRYPHYVEILVSVAANSNYLTDILVINPEYFYWIVNPSTLNTSLNKVEFKNEIKSTLSLLTTFRAKINALKTIKRKELLRIGLRDIYLKVPVKNITEELQISAKIAFLDASHNKSETAPLFDTFTFNQSGKLAKQSNTKMNRYNDKICFSKYDLLFINGNHYRGEQQILILDNKKEASVLKRIDQLDNVQFVVKLTDDAQYFDLLVKKYPHIKNLNCYSINDINKIKRLCSR